MADLVTYYELLEAAEAACAAAKAEGDDPRQDGLFADEFVKLYEVVQRARAALVPPGPPAAPRWPGSEAMHG